MLYLASDHRGFRLKEALKEFLIERNVTLEDAGAFEYDKDDDYVDFVRVASEKIIQEPLVHKGIFICGSGHGMSMVADKYKGLRAALAFNSKVAAQSREHEDSNVLVLPSDWLTEEQAKEIIFVWLDTKFSNEERHVRRLKKMSDIEEKNFSADSR